LLKFLIGLVFVFLQLKNSSSYSREQMVTIFILVLVTKIALVCTSIRNIFLTVQTMCESERIKQLSNAIRIIPDFPSPGILFRFVITCNC